jgi:hypothetical protein
MLFAITMDSDFENGAGQIVSPQGARVLFLERFEQTEDLAGRLANAPSPELSFPPNKKYNSDSDLDIR